MYCPCSFRTLTFSGNSIVKIPLYYTAENFRWTKISPMPSYPCIAEIFSGIKIFAHVVKIVTCRL